MNCETSRSGCKVLANDLSSHLWLCESVGVKLHPDQCSNLCFEDDRGRIGGFLFEQYTGRGGSMHCHFAGARPGWLSRRILRIVSVYAFVQAGVNTLFGRVNSNDRGTMSIDERIGFRQIGTLPGYFPDGDLILYQMNREHCRWLPAEARQEG